MANSHGEIQDNLTYGVSYIELFFNDVSLAKASAFFWKHEDLLYLVTNWHNLSGREPSTGQPKSKHGGVPNKVKITLFRKFPIEGRVDKFHVGWGAFSHDLCSDNFSQFSWFEHPEFGRNADIAVLPLGQFPPNWNAYIIPVNSNEFDGDVEMRVTQDVFIVGYPIGLIDECPIPVWKRATVATEPLVNPDGEHKFFVDTATRPGMSGSVAIGIFEGFGDYKKTDGSMAKSIAWKGRKVIGIYSGRLKPHTEMVQLGIIWKRHLIDETIKGRKMPSI